MTILFLARRFYPEIGGVEKHVMEIAKKFIKKGYKVAVITECSKKHHKIRSGQNCDEFEIEGISVHAIPAGGEDWFKKFRIWMELWKLRKLIKEADIVHCHDVFFWYLPFRFIYRNKPVLTTFHGYESFPISRKAILIRKVSEKLSFGNICIGDFIKKWYGTKPDFVSYGAVEIPKIKSQKPDTNSAVFIGRLDEQTGILIYNEAFEKLKKKYPEFEFLIVGDGHYKDLLNKKAKVIGFQKNPEKYFQSYRFAFVSRYLSILEAMAAKRLVFAVYDNPVKEDYLKMAPFAKFIIIENNADRLIYQTEKFINNPQIERQMVDKAYEWVKKQTWQEITKAYAKLWKKTIMNNIK